MSPLPFMLAAVAITAVAAVTDFRTGRIPNWLTLGGITAGLLGHVVAGWVYGGWKAGLVKGGFALAGLLVCSLVPGVVFWKGGMGGGDVKLFAALGALCGVLLGIEAQMYAFVLAAVMAPARLVYEGRLLRVLGGSFSMLLNPLRPQEKRVALPREMMTPFRLGPAIFIGTAAAVVIHLPKSLLP